jgi:hypothetical protein
MGSIIYIEDERGVMEEHLENIYLVVEPSTIAESNITKLEVILFFLPSVLVFYILL